MSMEEEFRGAPNQVTRHVLLALRVGDEETVSMRS